MRQTISISLIIIVALVSCEKSPNQGEFVCSIVSPKPNDTIFNGTPVNLEVRVSHNVSTVEFFLDDILVAEKSGMPLMTTWTPAGTIGGTHMLTVKIYPEDYKNVVLATPVILKYYLGELSQGGRIFNLDETGIHGLSVALQDFVYENKDHLPWGTEYFIGATDTVDGRMNTELLSYELPADYFWDNFKYGNTEWYVPSRMEMLMLLEFNDNSESDLNMETTYWTSTECCRANACAVDFRNKIPVMSLKADSLHRVRLVRRF